MTPPPPPPLVLRLLLLRRRRLLLLLLLKIIIIVIVIIIAIFTISTLRSSLTRTLTCSESNRVQVMCNASNAYHVQHVVFHEVRRGWSTIKFNRVSVFCCCCFFLIGLNHSIGNAIGPYENLLTSVNRRKLKWHGHVTRSSVLAKTILQGTVQGGRRRGKQRKRWEDNISEWTEWNILLRKAENREGWRKLIVKSTVVPQRSARLRDR